MKEKGLKPFCFLFVCSLFLIPLSVGAESEINEENQEEAYIEENEDNTKTTEAMVEENTDVEKVIDDTTEEGKSEDLLIPSDEELVEEALEDSEKSEINKDEISEEASQKDDIDEEIEVENDLKLESEILEEAKSSKIETFSLKINTNDFQVGDRHLEISEIKRKLNRIGFSGILVTDYYGDYTAKQVKKFQSYYGLSASGKVDITTKNKLDEIINSPFQEGKRHEETRSIKEKLNRLGYGKITVTTLYGSYTSSQVREFQKDYGLCISGIMDEVSLAKLNEAIVNKPFELGDSDSEIAEIKKKLNQIGFGGILVTDYYGNFTAKRVKQFQSYYGLSETGKVDNITNNKLNVIYTSPFQKGKSHNETRSIKEKLNKLGYGRITVTNFYGSYMESQVRRFQRDQGLRVSGIVDEVTLEELNNEVGKILFQLGDRDPGISDIKRKLNSVGFSGILVTDYYGNFTVTRVKEFQSYFGLMSTGVIDSKTKNKLDEIYTSPFQKGKSHSKTPSIKKELNNLGYGRITVTKYYGSYMESQVKKFQRDNGLRVNGIVDEVTLDKIKNSIVKIFIDPGHGGHDPGGSGFGLQEKSVVLDIALKTTDILNKGYYGIDIKQSRTNDTYLSLADRTKMANNWGADYLISLHTNAYMGKGNGFESFIFNGSVSQETRKRQTDIHDYLSKRISVSDRGKKQANFHMVRESTMPSLLLEYMFIDNKRENDLLRSASYRSSLARWTAEAIAHSFNLKKK